MYSVVRWHSHIEAASWMPDYAEIFIMGIPALAGATSSHWRRALIILEHFFETLSKMSQGMIVKVMMDK